MPIELIRAPGVTDSASSLSYPYTNELVNSLIKARVYISVGREDSQSFSAPGGLGALGADLDFRKRLHILTHFGSTIGSLPSSGFRWGCECRAKSSPGTRVCWIPLDKFNVDEFKLVNPSIGPITFLTLIVHFPDDQATQASKLRPKISSQMEFPDQVYLP